MCLFKLKKKLGLSKFRYVYICYNKIYIHWFDRKKTLVYCVMTWVLGFLVDLPNLVGWGGHYYDLKTLSCMWNRLASRSYSLFYPIVCIVVPCIAVILCYVRIFVFANQAFHKIADQMTHRKNVNDFKRSLGIAIGLLISFVLFTVCW